jgi:hypothetical protein
MSYKERSSWWLLLRSLLPSGMGLAGGLLGTVLIVGLHVVILSNDPKLLVPQLTGQPADDQLINVYTTVVRQPIDMAFGSNALGVLSSAVLWGVVGWLLYALADFLIAALRDLKNSDTDISIPRKNQVVRHPLHRQIVIRVMWRFLMGMLLVVTTVGLQPIVSQLLQRDALLLGSDSAVEMLKQAGIILMSWLGIFHLYTVLFRLFVMRTRVFGEILY